MSDKKEKINVPECLGKIDTKLDVIIQSNNKMMFAMLGIIAASLGLKFVNSPIWVISASYAAFFSSIFLLAIVIKKWRSGWKKIITKLLFVIFIIFSTVVKLYVFEAGIGTSPVWFSPIIDLFLTIICVAFVIEAWEDGNNFN